MRDTKEYFETVGRLDGVILLNWTEKTLQTQVDAIVKTSNQPRARNLKEYHWTKLQSFLFGGLSFV